MNPRYWINRRGGMIKPLRLCFLPSFLVSIYYSNFFLFSITSFASK